MLWIVHIVLTASLLIGCSQSTTPTSNKDLNHTSERVAAVIETNAVPFDQAMFDTASLGLGGMLWDRWWTIDENGELGVAPPETSETHALWPASNSTLNTKPSDTNTILSTRKSGTDTWRCKQCHGWDYIGRAGVYGDPKSSSYSNIKGILPAGDDVPSLTTAEDIFNFIDSGVVLAPDDHAFGSLMTIEALHAVTKFVYTMQQEASQGQSPTNFIDSQSKLVTGGSAPAGSAAYNESLANLGCADATCHGPDGKVIDFKDPKQFYVETYAWDNPWETLHKIRFGHPGADPAMPGLVISPDQNMANIQAAVDILRFAQDGLVVSTTGFDVTRFSDPTKVQADFSRGGILYDVWWTTANETTPLVSPGLTDHPLYPPGTSKTGDTTWRCKQCHGWDYLGVNGAYGNSASSNFTGINGIVANPDMTFVPKRTAASEIFDFLMAGQVTATDDHNFANQVATIDDIYALTRFVSSVQKEAFDGKGVGVMIDPWDTTRAYPHVTGGNGPKGLMLYNLLPFDPAGPDAATQGGCGTELCHGAKGQEIDFTSEGFFVDDYARDNPWETLHKVRFGHPGSDMMGLTDYQFSMLDYQAALDITAYSQAGLLRDPIIGGRLFDDWMLQTGLPAPAAGRHVLFDFGEWWFDPATISDAETWRCSMCHYYDFHGVDGLWNDLHWLMEMRQWSFSTLFTSIKQGYPDFDYDKEQVILSHNFGTYMSDREIWHLAQFMMEGMKLMSEGMNSLPNTRGLNNPYSYVRTFGAFYDYDGGGTADNAAKGRDIYFGEAKAVTLQDGTPYTCVSCHGADGLGVAEVDLFLSSWDDGFRFMHISRFGPAGSPEMLGVLSLALREPDGLHPGKDHDAADLLAYAQAEFLKRPGAIGTVSQIKQRWAQINRNRLRNLP